MKKKSSCRLQRKKEKAAKFRHLTSVKKQEDSTPTRYPLDIDQVVVLLLYNRKQSEHF